MAASQAPEGDKAKMTHARVACSAPYRVHVLTKTSDGVTPTCDCGRQHMVHGETYRYVLQLSTGDLFSCALRAVRGSCDGSEIHACADANFGAGMQVLHVRIEQDTAILRRSWACRHTIQAAGFCVL